MREAIPMEEEIEKAQRTSAQVETVQRLIYCDKAFESEKELFRHKAKIHGFYDWTRDSFVPPRTDASVVKNELLTDEFQKVDHNL